VVKLRTLLFPVFSAFRLQNLSAPVTHLDQGNELPLAPEGAPEGGFLTFRGERTNIYD
jgi:hypothetical protein